MIAIHGMGQQNRYDTMTSLARRLFDVSERGQTTREISVVNRGVDGGRSHVSGEFDVATVGGGEKDVAVFEAYWAPYTEGKIGFTATLWFLVVSAYSGVRLTVKDLVAGHGFQRWVFDDVRGYGISWMTLPLLFVTFSGVFGITAVMASALTALAVKLAAVAGYAVFARPAAAVLPLALAVDQLQMQFAAALAAWLILAAAVLAVGSLLRRIAPDPITRVVRGLLIAMAVAVALTAGVYGLAMMGVIGHEASRFLPGLGPGSATLAAWTGVVVSCVASVVPSWVSNPVSTVAIPVNLLLFWGVYFFAKQFVGDVAIYVSAHRVNRYWDTREAIRDTAHTLARDVYGCTDGGRWRYDEIYFVAHSLGSVIAYDTINAIFRDEVVLQQPIDAVSRTKGVLTFGSPLDKTAFLFRAYSSGSVERLAAVAASQPLLLDPQYRRFTWINIHSSADPISARIDYYGTPGTPLVDNRHDDESVVPLLAHVQYEGHDTFRRALCELIGAQPSA